MRVPRLPAQLGSSVWAIPSFSSRRRLAYRRHLLNGLADRVRNGENLVPGQLVEVDGFSHQIVPEEMPNPGDIVFTASDFYRRPDFASVPVIQLTYSKDGLFTWDSQFPDPSHQPRPGSFKA